MMFKKKKEEPQLLSKRVIILGVVVDGEIVEKFAVDNNRLAALFLSNPTFVDLEGEK